MKTKTLNICFEARPVYQCSSKTGTRNESKLVKRIGILLGHNTVHKNGGITIDI